VERRPRKLRTGYDRSILVAFRLSPEERQLLADRIEKSGAETISRYCREEILTGTVRVLPKPMERREAIQAAIDLLEVGHQLLARTGTVAPDEFRDFLQQGISAQSRLAEP